MVYVQNEMNGKPEMYKVVCMVWQALNSLVIWAMQSDINLRAIARLFLLDNSFYSLEEYYSWKENVSRE